MARTGRSFPQQAKRFQALATAATSYPISGSLTGSSSAAGAISDTEGIAGALSGTSSVTGAVLDVELEAGALSGTSSLTGAIADKEPLSGSISGTSSVSGTLSADSDPLGGAFSGTSTASASFTSAYPVAGNVSGSSSDSCSISVTGSFSVELTAWTADRFWQATFLPYDSASPYDAPSRTYDGANPALLIPESTQWVPRAALELSGWSPPLSGYAGRAYDSSGQYDAAADYDGTLQTASPSLTAWTRD